MTASGSCSWSQYTCHQEAEREDGYCQLPFSLLFSLEPQSMEWWGPYLGWASGDRLVFLVLQYRQGPMNPSQGSWALDLRTDQVCNGEAKETFHSARTHFKMGKNLSSGLHSAFYHAWMEGSSVLLIIGILWKAQMITPKEYPFLYVVYQRDEAGSVVSHQSWITTAILWPVRVPVSLKLWFSSMSLPFHLRNFSI